MRNFIFALVLLLAVVFVIGRLTEVQAIVEVVQRGDWRFLFLAVIVQILWFFNVAYSYLYIYKALDIHEHVRALLPMSAAASFLNIVAPSGGMSGMAVFISGAKKRNYSPARATIASAVYVLLDYAGFLCMLSLGLVVLFRRNSLNAGEIFASAALLTLAIFLATLLYLGMRSAAQLGKVLSRMARLVNHVLRPLIHREYLSEDRAHSFAHDAADGIQQMTRQPKKLVAPMLLALSKQVLLVMVLLLCFLAFKVPVSAGTVIAGFSIGYLFLIISPTPAGLGFVEGALTLILRSMYIPGGAAAVITLTYRAFTFWLPFLVGIIAFRVLDRLNHPKLMPPA